jgi:hypothetical protein
LLATKRNLDLSSFSSPNLVPTSLPQSQCADPDIDSLREHYYQLYGKRVQSIVSLYNFWLNIQKQSTNVSVLHATTDVENLTHNTSRSRTNTKSKDHISPIPSKTIRIEIEEKENIQPQIVAKEENLNLKCSNAFDYLFEEE